MNDKLNHQAKKKRKISNDDSYDNEGSFSFNKNKNENIREKNTNKNYVINFDKHLNPQKPIEIHKKNEYKNIINLNNVDKNEKEKNNFYLNNSDEGEYDNYNSYNNYNEENIFNNANNSNSNNNIDDNNDNNIFIQENNIMGKLNNYKLEALNFPRYEYNRGTNNNK